MADITAACIAKLKATSAVTSVIGSGSDARAWPDKIKELSTRYPCCVVMRTSGGQDMTLQGASGLEHAMIEVESWAETRAAADSLDAAVVTALTAGVKPTWGTVYLSECTAQLGSRDSGESPDATGGDKSAYWARTAFQVWYAA